MSNSLPDTDSPQYQERDWLYQEYVHKEKTPSQVADQCDGTKATISNRLNGTEIGTRGTSNSSAGNAGAHKNESWLQTRYVDQQITGHEIAVKLDVTDSTVHHWLTMHGIETRNLKL